MARKAAETIVDRKEQELKILHEVAKDISSNLPINDLLKRIVDMVMEFTGADSCLIYLYDKQNHDVVLAATNEPRQKILMKNFSKN